MGIKRAVEFFSDQLLPGHCVLCRSRCDSSICDGCDADLPVNHDPCYRCGVSVGLFEPGWAGSRSPSQLCGACISRPPPFDHTVAPLEYAFPATVLVQRFKFRRSFASGAVLSDRLLGALVSGLAQDEPLPECLVPVPLHPSRLFKRVFNQAEILACDVGQALNLPVKPAMLQRTRRTRFQPGLSARERRKNLRGAIVATQTSAKHVALVDDVMTTGATVAECARALKKIGVESVSVWVAARAQGA